jgi:hypothetical protein
MTGHLGCGSRRLRPAYLCGSAAGCARDEIRGRRLYGQQTCLFEALQETGATGLEPATSGVTGRFRLGACRLVQDRQADGGVGVAQVERRRDMNAVALVTALAAGAVMGCDAGERQPADAEAGVATDASTHSGEKPKSKGTKNGEKPLPR